MATYVYPNTAPVWPLSAMIALIGSGWPNTGTTIAGGTMGIKYFSPALAYAACKLGAPDIALNDNDLSSNNVDAIIGECVTSGVAGGTLNLGGGTNGVPSPLDPGSHAVIRLTCCDGATLDANLEIVQILDGSSNVVDEIVVSVEGFGGTITVPAAATAAQVANAIAAAIPYAEAQGAEVVLTYDAYGPSAGSFPIATATSTLFGASVESGGSVFVQGAGVSDLIANGWTVTVNTPSSLDDPLLNKGDESFTAENLWNDTDKAAAVAAQLATDVAAVTAKADKILTGNTILGVAGTAPATSSGQKQPIFFW